MIRRNWTIVAAAAIGILLAGCFRLPVSGERPPPAPEPSASASGAAQPADPRSARPTRTAGESLEGAFSYETMNGYVQAITPLIAGWLEETYANMPLPQQVLYVPRFAEGPEACLDGTGQRAYYSSESYEYCGANETIYIGQDMLWEFYSRTGDAGPAVGLAHEYGHHIQQQVGVPSPRTAAESIRHENQADCIAGAWTKYTDDIGVLEYPDDLEDIELLFPLIGSAEGPDRDHGTTSERIEAFNRGFTGGLDDCNAYYPATPLISR